MGSERKRDNLDKLYDALKSDGLVQKDRAQFRGKMLAPGMEGYRNRLALYKALKSDGLVKSGSYEEFSGYFLKRSQDGGAPAKPGGNAGGVGPSRLMTPSDLGGAWRYSPDALTDGKTGKWPQSLGTGGSQRPAAEPQGTVVKGRGADQTRAGSTALPVGGGNAQGGSMGSGGNAQGFDWSKARGNGYMQQMRDEWDYMRMTGGMSGSLQDMKPDVWDPLRGVKTVALKRDGSGNVVKGSDGKPQTVVVVDKDRARYAKELKEGADARRVRLEDGYDDRPITGFWEGAKQGSNLMWQGLKSFAGEALNLFGSNASDERAAIAVLDGLERNGYSGKQLERVYIENGLVRDALKATGYDLGKAKAWLEEKGGREFSLGDKLMMEAKYEIDRARPTEGFAAWAGNLAPQMVPSAVGMAVGAVTKNPSLVKAVGAVGLSSAALSTAGLSMKEARDHGATNGQTWAVGLADAAIECVTEKIPFDRYTKRLVSGGKRRVAREMADAVSVSGSTAQKELGRLLEEASGKLGGRLFGSRSVKEFMADVAAEGASEFVAEALETVTPMIYQKPEEYPTLSGILENGFEGMKGGLFMGSVLGGLSHVARRSQDRSRWKEQGGVYAGRTADGEVVEIVGHDKERGVFSVLRDGEVSEVADGDMSASHWFGYDEFMSGMLQHDSDAGYESGYSETSPDGMNERKNLAEVRRRKVVELLGEDAAGMLDEYGAEFAEGLELGDGERDAVLRYLEAKSAFDGMVQRVRDDIDGRLDENAREIDSNVNRVDSGGDGMVHPAVMKVGDRRVYVVSGHAVMSEDGTVVDLERSDESVVVRDAETGELEMVSPSALLRVDAAVDAEAEKAESGARIREAAAEEAAGLIDGRVGAAVGDVYETVGGDGVRHSVRVVGVDEGSGGVVVAVDGNEGSPVTMGLDELQAGVDAARVADLEAREAAELGEEGQAAGEGPAAEPPGTVVEGGNAAEETPGAVANGRLGPAAEQPGTVVEGGNAEETAGTAGTDGTAGTALSRVPVDERSGEPLFELADRETALDALYEVTDGDGERARAIVNAQLDQSSKALEALKKKPPRQKAVKLTGSPMQMAMAQQKAADDYKADMERYEAQLKDAKEKLDSWTGIYTLMNERARMAQDAQRARELAGHEAAVRERQQEFEARKQAEAAREAVGNGNPMPAITEKWNSAEKIDGHRDEIVLPNGERIKGRYVLHESGAASPSHDPQTWEKTDGFPMDGNGNSVNDRDYERDKDAQRVTRDIARSYDHRALQSPVVVSRDGVVLSGNGRTMAGELAARDNTDGDYIGYLKEYAGKYGFTPEQVAGMAHPRVSFVPDESMPYTAETFAKFNQQEMKSQNKTEYAVKLGKTVGDETFRRIVRSINGYDSLAAFYADDKGGVGAVYELHSAGVVPKAQLAEMVDVSSGEKRLSAIGREMLENMLVGKAFAGSPDVVRMLTSVPSMRQSVITALGEIVDNVGLGREWSLQHELAEAVKLVYAARTDGRFGFGDIVSVYARQGVLFADPDQLQTVADFNNVTMLLLADVLNDKRVTLLKHVIALYNGGARQSANGEQDLFEGGIRSREDILKDIIRFINENYGKRKEIEAARAAALERRKAESVQQDGTATAVGGGSEDTGGSGRNEGSNVRGQNNIQTTETLTGEKKDLQERILGWLTEENIEWAEGKDLNEVIEHFGNIPEPIAVMPPIVRKNVPSLDGDYLYCGKAYMIDHHANHHPELDIDEYINIQTILDNYDDIKDLSDDGKLKIAFVKKLDKGYAVVAELLKENEKIVLHKTFFYRDAAGKRVPYKNKPSILERWSVDGSTTISPAEVQQPADTENISALDQSVSVSKGSEKNGAVQIGTGKTEDPAAEPPGTVVNGRLGPAAEQPGTVVEGGNAAEVTPGAAAGDVATAVAAAEASTDVSPTEGQKKAGNYRKGHVRIDGFDVSIEQPKGSVRRGTDADGKKWEQKMNNTYGYIRGTEGVDGDHIDVFLSDDPSQGDVFVVDQVNGDGSFDEHKVMYGFASEGEARSAYLSNYEEGWTGLGAITHVTKEEFRKWVNSSRRKTKPFADYKHVKATTEDVDQRRTDANDGGRLPVHRDFAMYRNNVAGNVAMVAGDGGRGYVVRYYENEGDADAGLSIGEQTVSPDEFKRRLDSGELSPVQGAVRRQKGAGAGGVSSGEAALRDALVDVLRGAGVEVVTDAEEGQRVLDEANGEARMQAKKRALETASLSEGSERSLTVVSSADGAKILGNLDKAIQTLESSPTQPKTFVGDIANSLGATRHNSKSEYATFETKNGRVVTIRLADHNATVSNFDMRGELDGISIVVSPKKSAGVTNDGDAHVVEYYYDSIKLRRADGKPLADIVRSIKQALYSGEFNDTTGLAEVQEVNADEVRQQKVYHGSGADFDAFDHSHMGEGEGAQAYGWGTYVTEVEGIGRAYAMANNNSLRKSKLESDISRLKEALPFRRGDAKREGEEELKRLEEELSMFDESWKSVLYTVEIPDDNGGNYLSWEKRVKDIPQDKQQSIVTLLQNNGWTLNEENPLADFIKRYEKQDKSIVINQLASGADLYEEFSQALGSPQKASKLLSEAGFTGISYPTGYLSGVNQDGKRNYVIFNDADARITDKVRFFRTPDGHAYGFTKGGNIYIDPRIATAETPIHEYAHLWSSAMRELNPEEWGNIVGLMKGTGVWDEVKRLYPELKTDDEIADEVLAHYSGRRGAERLRSAQAEALASDGGVLDKAAAVSGIERVRQALGRFWKGVADWLGIHFTTAEDVADKVLSDLLHGVNPAFAVKDGGVRYDANSEEAGIVARAKAEGTYMKAPNGKPSRLTPRQWVQVRTKAFKEWFGDWEKAARVLEVIPALKEHGFKNFDEAKAWAKEHIVRTLTDAETGGKGEIRISNNAVAKFLSESAVAKSDSKDVHLSVLKVLPDVIRKSVDAEQHPDYKKGGDGSRSVGNGVNEHVTIHRLYGAVNIDGKTYRVKVTLKEYADKNEPSRAYSYEATKIELLAGTLVDGKTTDPSTNNSITAANLLQDVDKSYGNGEKLLDCSKVVDENGEPLVVYHGTRLQEMYFKDGRPYTKSIPRFYEFNDGKGFFTDNEKAAQTFATGQRGMYNTYLCIKNPYVFDCEGQDWDAIKTYKDGETVSTDRIVYDAKQSGNYDGVILINVGGENNGLIKEQINEAIPFSAVQIKSADENVGTFDGSNPDVRYQFVGEKGAAAMDKAEEASVRLDNLAVAREMEASGKDAKAVKLATGWERGGDGKWRYEIEDFDSSGLENLVREDNKKKLRLSEHRRTLLGRKWEMESEVYPDRYFDEFSDAEREQWDREHTAEIAELNDLSKEIDRLKKQEESSGIYTDLGTVVGKDHVLFKYYPELEGAVVHITDMPSSVGGNYKPGVITLNRGALYDSSILNHEVQHAIQEIEGFARGGSVSDVRKRIMKRISELDGVSEHAKEMLARQVEYRALASKLGYVYERLMKNGEDWAVRAASDNYWEAMNTLDNDENSTLENAYPKGKNAAEIAKEGFNREKAIEELKRLSDYYASQISAEDMRNIKASEALSGKMDGKSDEELYLALGGEVEARNVQSRLGMTAAERRASLASETEDVAREDQIFLEDGFGVSEKGAGAVVGNSSAYKAKDGSTVTWRSLFSEEEMRGISEEKDGVGSFDPTSVRLRKLEAGETCHVERRYVENGMFDFTGKDKIESDDDVAYIFRQLENAAVENSFMVLVKDGKPTVIHLAMGAYSSTMAPFEQAFVAYSKLNPDDVYFVHNHPSGKLQASRQDQETLDRIKKAFGDDVVNPGIIIDTTSGKYGMFDGMNIEQEMPVVQEGAVPIKVYNFGKQVFARDWNPRNAFKIKSSDDVAEFISSHRLGEHKKMSLLVLGNDNSVVANLFLPFTRIGNLDNVREVCNLMSDYIHQCGGVCGFLYGNYDYTSDENRLISRISSRMKQLGTRLMDVIHVEHSAYNEGVVYEPEASDESLDVVNKRFNAELGRLTEENKDKVVLSLGRPSDILLASGVSDKPMKLYGNKVIKKMRKHGFALAELKDLPRAVADPIAVFDNYQLDGNRTVLTELQSKGKNIMVAVTLGKDGVDVDFNIVSSVFGKGEDNIVDWLNKGYARYINKAKALNYLHHSDRHISEALSNPKLFSAAKVVEDFENPRLGVEENGYAGHRTLRPSVEGGLAGKAAAAKRERAGQMAERLNTRVRIIDEVESITHGDARVQERRRRSKGWYDPKTGEVVVVIPNNRDVEDVAATVAHEAIAHKGLRELVGEERYDEFLDEVYGHLREDLKKAVDAVAGRAFVADVTGNGGRAGSYEQHRRRAVDELFGRLAEKPFEEFSEGERTLWQKLRAAVRNLLDRFLGSLKLPKWFELGDNELRYMLWRSKERLEHGREHPIDAARDIVKREELGLTEEARYRMGDAPDTFKARQKRAVENKGTVMPGLNDAQVKVVGNIPRHPYTGNIAEATSQAIEAAKAKYAPNGEPKTLHYKNFGVEFDYSISGNAIEIVLSAKHQGKSVNKGVHLALAEHLDRVIGESIEVEEHPDRIKTGDVRDNSKINPDALMHRFYGVARIDGKDYRVMTLMKEENRQGESNGIHSYEVQKIEVLNDETPSTSNGVGTPNSELEAYPLAKLIQKVGKTMETDKNLLDESKLADESTDLYRDGGETDDVWTDGSMGLQERITAAAVRLSGNHREDRKLRNDAVRVIGSNLSELRKAMGLQRTFDMTTVKRVADLARVLISSGYISNATSGEVNRLLSAVKNSVGHENIDESIRKVMDIMVDNQLKQGEAALHEMESIKGSKVWTNCHAYVADALSK